MRLESVQVGQPRTYGTPGAEHPLERPWTSAIRKEPVVGPVWAGREGLSGDQQYDRNGHGGPERALLMYSADHYPRWRGEWGREGVGAGGENHRSGGYLRVLHEGWLEAGAEVVLADRPFPQWTIRRAAEVKRHRADRREEAGLLAACPALQAEGRRKLGGRGGRGRGGRGGG